MHLRSFACQRQFDLGEKTLRNVAFRGVIASLKIPWIGLRNAADAFRQDGWALLLIDARISASGGASV